jgi:hypothetical protein
MKSKKVQSRSWGIIIPCEWECYMAIVHKAKALAKYYYWIKHDSDFYEGGEIKKEHIHLLFTFNSSRDLSTVQNYFTDFKELKENSYEKINNIHGAKRYLIHADNPEKYQYQIIEVETNDRLYLNAFTEKMSSVEEINIILGSFESFEKLSCKDFCLKFASLLENMNSYQKMVVISNLRREWRIQNMRDEFEHIGKGTQSMHRKRINSL